MSGFLPSKSPNMMKYKGQKVSKGSVGQSKELKLAAEKKESKQINPKWNRILREFGTQAP